VEWASCFELDQARIEIFLQEQTWAKRTDQLLDAVTLRQSNHPATGPACASHLPAQAGADRLARALPPPPRGAMPDAPTDLERWRAFARHLERLAQDRQAHVRELEQALEQSSLVNKVKRMLRIP